LLLVAANDEQKKALNRAVEIIDSAERAVTQKFSERQFYSNMYNTYDDVLKAKQWWQAKFAHALPFFTIETKASFLYEGVFGQGASGVWQVHPWDQFSSRSAEVTSKLLKSQEDNSNFVKNFYLGAKSLNIYGDWFLETHWDHKKRLIQQPDQFKIGFDGEVQRPVVRRERQDPIEMVEKNQPDASTLYVNSVWPDPKATCMETARYICVRREIPFETLKKAEQDYNLYINVDNLKGTQMPKVKGKYYDSEPYSPHYKSGNPEKQTSSPIDTENQLVEVIDIIYPATGEIESIGNRAVYLGRTLRYNNLRNPIVHIKNYEQHGKFFGTSDFKAIAPMWKLINQYQSLEADNMLMHHRGYTKVQRDAGPNVQEAYGDLSPGDVIMMNNLGGSTHERPDLFAPLALQAKQALIQEAQTPMGMNEILSGATPSSNVRSSGQFSQLANFGAKMLSQSVRTISQGLKEVGKNWVSLNYELLDPDATVPVLGQSGVEMIQIQPGDIPPLANVSIRLSSDLEAQKQQKVQQMMQLVNMASAQVPGFAASKATKDIFRTLGGSAFDDPDQYFLLSDEESAALRTQQFRQQGAGQEPGLAGSTQVPDPNQIAAGNATAGEAAPPTI